MECANEEVVGWSVRMSESVDSVHLLHAQPVFETVPEATGILHNCRAFLKVIPSAQR